MPLDSTHAPRLRAIFHSSEAWMLRSILECEPHRMLGIAPSTLSTFDAGNLLDVTQQETSFVAPARGLPPEETGDA